MRIVFAGTPKVAARTLERLLADPEIEVAAVITRPDAPQGRSKRLVPSPVAALGEAAGIEVLRPKRVVEIADRLAKIAPQACPVVAYGALIPTSMLDIAEFGWVNVHYSLLPRWRGAAPVQRAILAGDEVTGVSVFRLVTELDAGPLFSTVEVPIESDETAGELLERLTDIGADALLQVLHTLADGTARAHEQNQQGVTLAPKLDTETGRIDWYRPAAELGRQIRACNPAPMAWTTWAGERFRVLRVTPELTGPELAPGRLAVTKRDVLVGTAAGWLRLEQVQPLGRKPMPGADWARGLRDHQIGFE